MESRGGFEAFDRDFGLLGRFVLVLVRERTKRRNEWNTCDPEEEPGVRGVIGGEEEEEDEKKPPSLSSELVKSNKPTDSASVLAGVLLRDRRMYIRRRIRPKKKTAATTAKTTGKAA